MRSLLAAVEPEADDSRLETLEQTVAELQARPSPVAASPLLDELRAKVEAQAAALAVAEAKAIAAEARCAAADSRVAELARDLDGARQAATGAASRLEAEVFARVKAEAALAERPASWNIKIRRDEMGKAVAMDLSPGKG